MAIDTAAKRRVAAAVGLQVVPSVTPDSDKDDVWRYSVSWSFLSSSAGSLTLCASVSGDILASHDESNQQQPDDFSRIGDGTILGRAQSLIVLPTITGPATYLCFFAKKTGSPTGNATVSIYNPTGTHGTDAKPDGGAALASATFNVALLTTTAQMYAFAISGWTPDPVGVYVAALEYSGGDLSNRIDVGSDTAEGHGGNPSWLLTSGGGVWATPSINDLIFSLKGAGSGVVLEPLSLHAGPALDGSLFGKALRE